jgi:hypothetical protein
LVFKLFRAPSIGFIGPTGAPIGGGGPKLISAEDAGSILHPLFQGDLHIHSIKGVEEGHHDTNIRGPGCMKMQC